MEGRSTPFELSMILGQSHSGANAIEPVLCLDEQERLCSRSLDMAVLQDQSCMHLSRSLLVRLKLKLAGAGSVNVLCTTQDISSSGMLVFLPCQLGLNPGSLLEMDLFLEDRDFVSIQGRARRISRIGNESTVGYCMEVDFYRVNGLVEKQIAALVHSSQISSPRSFLAQ